MIDPHPAMIGPFVAMLLAIAVMPVVLKHHWERCYHFISAGLGAITVGYYVFFLRDGARVLHEAGDYVSFMALTASLFVVAGGIHIRVRGGARPSSNALFLLTGALLANVVGATGASMLLIRPWIRMNKYRYTGLHTCFFIFIVSNAGGGLTPMGPPLFLGYLKGVPFGWMLRHCWAPWCTAVLLLTAIFYALDRVNFLRAPKTVREQETESRTFRIGGLSNLFFLAAIIGAVFVNQPPFLRELIMTGADLGSYFTTPKPIHEANHFRFGPVKEVGWLFLGIFSTMAPVIDYMQFHAAKLGIDTVQKFYWLTGGLSSVLDNAPTYLTFLANAFGRFGLSIEDAAQVRVFCQAHPAHMAAISLGAVFFGAGTYIGNGPNFMVKSIADEQNVRTPDFFAYIFRYSLPVLLPVLCLVALLFL